MTSVPDGFLAVVLAFFWNAALILAIRHLAPPGEAAFLVKVYAATLLLRYSVAVFLNDSADDMLFATAFWGDSATYDVGGHLLALRWSGESVVNTAVERSVSGFGFYYVVAALYYVFGRNQLLVQFVNGTIGAVTVLVIYALASHIFGRLAARRAALMMAFFPQMIFWSSAMYKDPATMLCLALCMYAFLRLREDLSVRHVLLFVAAALALMTLRFYVFYFMAFAALGTFVWSQRRGVVRGAIALVLLVTVFLGAFNFAVSRETIERQARFFDLRQLQVVRADQAMWGKSAFATEGDVSTLDGALAALPTGIVNLLFAPFPWSISGLRQALTLPETLVWYALMPAFLRGLRFAVRHRFREALPLLAFMASLTIACALFQGNVGTAYRQRAQISMFFFVFMGVGLVAGRRGQES